MKSDSTGDEIHFPVDTTFDKEDDEIVIEAPAAWPDIPPLPGNK